MSKTFLPTKSKSVSNKLRVSTSSARSKQLTTCLTFQFPVRQSWKPQRDHTAAPLPREVRIEATRSLIHSGAARGRLFAFRELAERWSSTARTNAPTADLPLGQDKDGFGKRFTTLRAMAVMQATAATTPNSSPARK